MCRTGFVRKTNDSSRSALVLLLCSTQHWPCLPVMLECSITVYILHRLLSIMVHLSHSVMVHQHLGAFVAKFSPRPQSFCTCLVYIFPTPNRYFAHIFQSFRQAYLFCSGTHQRNAVGGKYSIFKLFRRAATLHNCDSWNVFWMPENQQQS